jgi:hypothetical protein
MEINDMYEVTEVTVGAKKSLNFQTYECTQTAVISKKATDLDVALCIKVLQAKCRKYVQEQIDIDKRTR